MAARSRLLRLQGSLSSIAHKCEQASRGAMLANVSSHTAAGHALRLAAASLVQPGCSWRPAERLRAFAAQAAPVTDSEHAQLTFTESAVQRLGELAEETPGRPLVLRLTVEGGGCSGFTYHFSLEQSAADDDRIVQHGGATLVCDPVSYEFVRGSKVDYTTDIIRSAFEVVSNPNATQSCGCGSSFAPKV